MPLVQHASLRALALLATCALAAVVALVGPAAGRPLAHAQDGDGTPPFDPVDFGVGLEAVAGGFERPVHVAEPGDGSGRLFVVEQAGRIRIVRDGEVLPEPFLDIVEIVESGGNEQGLLSVAFHPDYADNGLFYVGFTARTTDDEDDSVGDNTVARYRVSADDPDRADPDSREVLLAVDDPYPNHNGGLVLFGPDGYLYAGLGDGGSGGDPEGNGQNTDTLLGSILRLDVDGAADGEPYAIPADNPFADGDGGAPEVWTYGLRNPWRFSFDRATGDLYVADVGQNQYEEIDFVPAADAGGTNFGWNITEGAHCFRADSCDTDGLVLPIAEYGRDLGSSVTGGYVYRGEDGDVLRGVYLYADFGSGRLWGLGRDADGAWASSEPIDTGLNVSSFGEDAAGELYLTAFDGTLYRVVAPEE